MKSNNSCPICKKHQYWRKGYSMLTSHGVFVISECKFCKRWFKQYESLVSLDKKGEVSEEVLKNIIEACQQKLEVKEPQKMSFSLKEAYFNLVNAEMNYYEKISDVLVFIKDNPIMLLTQRKLIQEFIKDFEEAIKPYHLRS